MEGLSSHIGALVESKPNNKLTSFTVRQEQSNTICGVTICLSGTELHNSLIACEFKSIGKCPSGEELFTIKETA